jgi:hypothetical protein
VLWKKHLVLIMTLSGAPPPQWGQGWRKGDYYHYNKMFSPELLKM